MKTKEQLAILFCFILASIEFLYALYIHVGQLKAPQSTKLFNETVSKYKLKRNLEFFAGWGGGWVQTKNPSWEEYGYFLYNSYTLCLLGHKWTSIFMY